MYLNDNKKCYIITMSDIQVLCVHFSLIIDKAGLGYCGSSNENVSVVTSSERCMECREDS